MVPAVLFKVHPGGRKGDYSSTAAFLFNRAENNVLSSISMFSITGPSVKQSGELGRKVVTISVAATTKSASIACLSFLDLHFPPPSPYLQNVLLTKQAKTRRRGRFSVPKESEGSEERKPLVFQTSSRAEKSLLFSSPSSAPIAFSPSP